MNLLQKFRLGKSQQAETFGDDNEEGGCRMILLTVVKACGLWRSFLIWVFPEILLSISLMQIAVRIRTEIFIVIRNPVMELRIRLMSKILNLNEKAKKAPSHYFY